MCACGLGNRLSCVILRHHCMIIGSKMILLLRVCAVWGGVKPVQECTGGLIMTHDCVCVRVQRLVNKN